MSSETPERPDPFKFGVVLEGQGVVPHRYKDTWERQKTGETERLVIGAKSRQIELLLELAQCLSGPFGMLYVLLVSRLGHEPGRYQSPEPSTFEDTETLLRAFRVFLEHDGRHHVWLISLGDQATLVYDNHNLIYAYGPLDRYIKVLKRAGLDEGETRIPAPHQHCYNAVFDSAEDEVLKLWRWEHYPLAPGDDPA